VCKVALPLQTHVTRRNAGRAISWPLGFSARRSVDGYNSWPPELPFSHLGTRFSTVHNVLRYCMCASHGLVLDFWQRSTVVVAGQRSSACDSGFASPRSHLVIFTAIYSMHQEFSLNLTPHNTSLTFHLFGIAL
jgi:hypothetical protein